MQRDLPSLRIDQETQEACEAAAWREARRASVAMGAEKARRIERAWEVLADLAPRLTFQGLAAIGYGNSTVGFSGVIAMSLPYYFNYPVFRCVNPAALDDDIRSTDPAAIAIKIGAGGVVVATGVDFIDDRDPVDSMRVPDDDTGAGLDVPEVVLAAARRIGPLPAPMDEAPDPERAPAGAR